MASQSMRLFVAVFSVYNAIPTNGVIILREPGADSVIISVCAGRGQKLVRKYICRFVGVMARLTGTPVKLRPMDGTLLTLANAEQVSRPSSGDLKPLNRRRRARFIIACAADAERSAWANIRTPSDKRWINVILRPPPARVFCAKRRD